MNKITNLHSHKLKLIYIFFIIIFFLIALALFNWQFIDNDRFLALANERYKEVRIPAVRGSILANDLTTLAFSEPRFDFYIWKPELTKAEERGLQTRDEFIEKVSLVLDVEKDDLVSKMGDKQLWIKVEDKLTPEKMNKLLALKSRKEKQLEGLRFEYVNSRAYPEERLGSHILGFFGYNESGLQVGIGGLEQYWERSLRPIEGVVGSEIDSFGNTIFLAKKGETEAKPGVTLVTTIDKNIQAVLEKKLMDGIQLYQADSATGIIMNPKTGAIIAMANFPDFNPNEYYKEKDGNVFGNLAITTPYEIGSVAKVFTLSSALDLNKLEYDEVILPNGHKGCEVITKGVKENSNCADPKIQCVCTFDRKPVNQAINVLDAIVSSDNIAFKHIGEKLTNEEFFDYLRAFGVGSISGVDLTGESTGILPKPETWSYSDNAVFSYGHGYQITPLQAIDGINVIANKGVRMQPYVVESVIDGNGKQSRKFEPREVEQVIAPEVAGRMGKMMNAVFRSNIPEQRYQPLLDYNLSLKSGTALIPYKDKPGYSSNINATYVGFDNSSSKSFIMLIKLENPKVGDLSFYNARILWLDTFIAIKDYLAVPKEPTN